MFYEFGEFRLDIQLRLLTAGANARPIPLPPKAFETLLYFVERRGELLDKGALMKAVWPNIVVEENSLNQNISVIRRALGESPGEHRFIVTEPGRGYRFVADVRVNAAAPDATRTEVPALAQPAATAEQRKSIAVLPFANLTGDPSKEYFSDGMSEELLHRLARIPGLKVPSRTSSFSYKGRNIDVRQIARDLDVGVVLEGSVRSAGDRIRVTAQLIDGRNGFHLWSQNYDRDFGDLFALQDELAHAIVNTLRITLDGQANASAQIGAALEEPPTRDLEAYQLYMQAMSMQVMGSPNETIPRVVAMFERAIKRDPGFARAHSALATVRSVSVILNVPLPGSLADAESDILRGLARDSSLGAPHAALGTIYAAQGKWVTAEERYREAFDRDDADPATHQAYGLFILGSAGLLLRSLEACREAHRLAPAWVASLMTLAVAHMCVDHEAEARRYADLGVNLGLQRTGAPMADLYSQLEVREARYDAAAETEVGGLPAGITANGGADTVREVYRALRDGGRDAAHAVHALDDLYARTGSADMPQFMQRRFMLWYTMLGALDPAFDVANRSLDFLAQFGTIGTAWGFLWMREMLPLRQDPRFQSMCRRMGLFDYWTRHGPPDNCELKDGRLICR
jgi:TolB-like protein